MSETIGTFKLDGDVEVAAVLDKYADGNVCVRMTEEDPDFGPMPYGVLSVNIPESSGMLGKGEFFAKSWSENGQLFKAAIGSGLFADTGRKARCGMCEAPVLRVVA